jgi:hypothetical protein
LRHSPQNTSTGHRGQARLNLTAQNASATISRSKEDRDEDAHWIWNVTPLEAGDQELASIASVRIKLPNGEEESKESELFRCPFNVRVDGLDAAKAFAMGNWQYLATTLLDRLFEGGRLLAFCSRSDSRILDCGHVICLQHIGRDRC